MLFLENYNRYFKFIFPSSKLFNLQFWFNIHRPFMFSVSILSIVGLIVILYELKWTWIDKVNLMSFIHSIFGIVSISLATIQVYFLWDVNLLFWKLIFKRHLNRFLSLWLDPIQLILKDSYLIIFIEVLA